tara:strand:+ start:300 stop:644 length:345 start_codon:yes stop_codon:yes gene_type:complete
MKLIYIVSRIRKKCPFSKKIIKPKTILCVFNKHQYNSFVIQITQILSSRLPNELIEKIIELTKYKKLLYRTGLQDYTNWINLEKKYYLNDLFSSESDLSDLSDLSDIDSYEYDG